MSSSSDIAEAIEEDIAEEAYEEDEELRADVDIRADIAESLTESETSLASHDESAVKTDKLIITTFTAIEEFSSALANTVVKEALLINEIHERDKLNVNERPQISTAGLPPGTSDGQGRHGDASGYDPYLMQKLLRSEADPDEATIIEHMPEGSRYPGLDPDDKYVKEEVDRSTIEHNDKNNNQVESDHQEGEDDTALQTIHEDSELELTKQREKPENEPQSANSKHENEDEREAVHQVETEGSDNKDKSIKFTTESGDHDGTHTEWTAEPSMTEDKGESAFSSSEESEDEEDCCEMTYKEKKAVVLAVRDGDIDLVELLLEKRRAHMDMLWYGETLLMVAIRMCQESMAEFLIDNDIDLEYERRIVERDEKGAITIYKVTARQMAFDRGMEDLVELIDHKTNNLFGFIKLKERNIRIRRPRPPTPPTPETMSEDEAEEDGCETERGTNSQKDGTRRKRAKSDGKDSENSMSTFSDDESVQSSETKHKTMSNKTKSKTGSRDDLSQVFGPDEGYETMSPISPACVQAPHRLEHNIVGTREHVNIRGTRSSHLLRTHTAARRGPTNTEDNNPNNRNGDNVGSYTFERQRWNYCRSAPVPKNYSTESIPDSVVRYGLPFVHGTDRKGVQSANGRQRLAKSQPSPITSAYEEIVKVLSGSRLLNSNYKSSRSTLPSIHDKTQIYRDNTPKNLNINYIYANRGSANSSRSLQSVPTLKPHGDLLPKRKLRV